MEIAKFQTISGTGNPLLATEMLLAALLLELGYPLFQGQQKNWQDITLESDLTDRRFILLFAGISIDHAGEELDLATAIKQLTNPDQAESPELKWRAEVLNEFIPGNKPSQILGLLLSNRPQSRILATYTQLLTDLRAMPRHLELHRGSRKYWFPMDWSPEKMESKIAQMG